MGHELVAMAQQGECGGTLTVNDSSVISGNRATNGPADPGCAKPSETAAAAGRAAAVGRS